MEQTSVKQLRCLSLLILQLAMAACARDLCAAELGIGAAGAATVAAAGEDALIYVHVRNPQEFLTKATSAVRQMNPNFNPIESLRLGEPFHNPGLEGVDLTQPITVVLLNTKKYQTENCALTTLSAQNVDSFLNAVGISSQGGIYQLNPETKSAAIREFRRATTQTDRKAYDAALAAGQNPDISNFQKKISESFFVGTRDKQVVVGPTRELVEKALTSQAPAPNQVLAGDVVITFRLPAILSTYDAEIKAFQQQMQTTLTALANQPGNQAKMMSGFMEMYLEGAQSAQTAELAASLKEGDLGLALAVVPKPNTDLTKFLAAQDHPSADLLKLAPPSSAIAAYLSIRTPPDVNTWAERLLTTILNSQGSVDASQSAELVKVCKEQMANWGGEMVWYAQPPPEGSKGFIAIAVQKVNDSAKARELVGKGVQLQSQMPKPPGFEQTSTYLRDALKLQNVSLDKLTIVTKTENPLQAQSLNLLGLGQMTFYNAYPSKFVVMGLNDGSLGDLQKTLDALNRNQSLGLIQSADYQTATRGFPTDVNGLFFVSLERLLHLLASTLPQEMAGGQISMLTPIFDGSGINFSGYTRLQADNAQFYLRIPLQKIQEAIQRLQQQQQQPQQQQPQQQQPQQQPTTPPPRH